MPGGEPTTCSSCSAELAPRALFCHRCGSPLHPSRCAGCDQALPPGARFCPICGRATGPSPAQVPSGGERGWTEERKLATVLFGDISGFTALSSRLEPDEVRELVNSCFAPLAGEVERVGGSVVKYIGDCIMAVFGVPVSSENDAERAVRAALAMTAQLRAVAPEIRLRYGADVSMRIGVNTGVVMVGSVGRDRHRFDVMGSAVNLASRVESVARPGQVVIAPATYRIVKHRFTIRPQGAATLKGFSEPVPVYEVLGSDAGVAAPAADLDGLDAAIVVRERELACLRDHWGAVVVQRQSRVVKVLGDAGVGKGRMLLQLRSALEIDVTQPELLTAAATAASTGSRPPLAIVGDLLRTRFELRGEGDAQASRARLRAELLKAWPAGDAAAGERAAEVLADAAGLGLVDGAKVIAHGAAGPGSDNVVVAAFVEWLTRLCADRPVAMLLQDLHWADATSLAFVDRLLEAARGLPLFAVLAARPEIVQLAPGWDRDGEEVAVLRLEPLTEAEMTVFLEHLLAPVDGLPETIIAQICARAEGNLEYAREYVRLLVDQGAIAAADGPRPWRWVPEQAGALSLPVAVRGVLQSRLDRLGAAEKELLKAASVVGRTFWTGALAALQPHLRHAEVGPLLGVLHAKGLVKARRPSSVPGEEEHLFRSQTLCDVCYDSLPASQRTDGHRRVAEWLRAREERWPGANAELAGHFAAAGDDAAARPFWLLDARAAAAVWADEAAQHSYLRALAGWPDEEERGARVEVYRELAMVLSRLGQLEPALESLAAAAADLRAVATDGDYRRHAQLCLDRALILKEFGRIHPSLEALNEGLTTIGDQPGDLVAVELLGRRAFQRLELGDLDGARADCDAGLAQAEAAELRAAPWLRARANLMHTLGGIHLRRGDLDAAEQCFSRGVELRQGAADETGQFYGLTNLAAVAFHRGQHDRAIAHYRAAFAVASRTHRRKHVVMSTSNLGQAHLAKGELEASLPLLERALAEARRFAFTHIAVDTGVALVRARVAAGALGEALRELAPLLAEAERLGAKPLLAAARLAAAEALVAAPSDLAALAEARAHASAAQQHFVELGDRPSRDAATALLARLDEGATASKGQG